MLEFSMNYLKGHLLNFMQIFLSFSCIFLVVKSYFGNLRLVYIALVVLSFKNSLPFFGLSIYLDDNRYEHSGHAAFLHELTIVSGFFNSFVIALCFQRDSKLWSQLVHYLYFIVLIYDNIKMEDMKSINHWIF